MSNHIDLYLRVEEGLYLIRDVVELLAGNRDVDPLVVLPKHAGEVRANADNQMELDVIEPQLRAIAAAFGINNLFDIGSVSGVRLLEGGKAWKIQAELQMALGAMVLNSTIIAASPYRQLGDDERKWLGGGDHIRTEYDAAQFIARRHPSFSPLAREVVVRASYDIQNGFAVGSEQSGQFVHIGSFGCSPVVMLRVDRESYINEEGKAKYRNQPNTVNLIRIVDEVLMDLGVLESGITLVTSNNYPSRNIGVLHAGLTVERDVWVASYGTRRLARVRGTEASPPALNQLLGEFKKIYDALVALKQDLGSPW